MIENYQADFVKRLNEYTETLLWGTEASLKGVVTDFEIWVKDHLYDLSKIRDYSICLKISDILVLEEDSLAWKVLIIALKAAKDFNQFQMVVERLQSLKRGAYSYVYSKCKMPYEHIAKIGYALAEKNADYIFLHKVLENNISALFISRLVRILDSRCS